MLKLDGCVMGPSASRRCVLQVDVLASQVAELEGEAKDSKQLQSRLQKAQADKAEADQKLFAAINENASIQAQVLSPVLKYIPYPCHFQKYAYEYEHSITIYPQYLRVACMPCKSLGARL